MLVLEGKGFILGMGVWAESVWQQRETVYPFFSVHKPFVCISKTDWNKCYSFSSIRFGLLIVKEKSWKYWMSGRKFSALQPWSALRIEAPLSRNGITSMSHDSKMHQISSLFTPVKWPASQSTSAFWMICAGVFTDTSANLSVLSLSAYRIFNSYYLTSTLPTTIISSPCKD